MTGLSARLGGGVFTRQLRPCPFTADAAGPAHKDPRVRGRGWRADTNAVRGMEANRRVNSSSRFGGGGVHTSSAPLPSHCTCCRPCTSGNFWARPEGVGWGTARIDQGGWVCVGRVMRPLLVCLRPSGVSDRGPADTPSVTSPPPTAHATVPAHQFRTTGGGEGAMHARLLHWHRGACQTTWVAKWHSRGGLDTLERVIYACTLKA